MTAIAFAIVAVGSGFSVAHQIGKSINRAQAGADNAALTALEIMIDSEGRIDDSRMPAARTAASRVAAGVGATVASVQAVPETQSVSLVFRPRRGSEPVLATARYVAPGKALRPDRVAVLP